MLPTPEVIGADYTRVYEPAEDSFLLLDLFEELKDYFTAKTFSSKTPLVVEIGTGTGIVTTFLNKNILPHAIYLATDLNPYSCQTLLRTNRHNATSFNLDVIRCDLVSSILPHSIDMIVFNPPYVPAENVPDIPQTAEEEDIWVDIALNGGPTGMDVTSRLLDSLRTSLSVQGEAYILFCARNKPEEVTKQFIEKHESLGEKWQVELLIHRKAGWEELSVYRFKKLS